MRATLQPLFGIAIEHSYFSGGGCPALALSLRGWANGAARARSLPGRCDLFVDPTAFDATKVPGRETWTFGLTPVDRNFTSYTDTICQAGSIVLFAGSLSAGTPPSALAPSIVARRRRRFQDVVPASAAGRTLDVRRHSTCERVRSVVAPEGDDRLCVIDIGDEPEGRFELVDGNVVLLDFYAADHLAPNTWGVIEVDAQAEPGTLLTVNLAARAVIWRYLIVDGSGGRRSLETSTLMLRETARSVNARATFTLVGRQIIDGSPAVVFQSTRPLALSDRPGDQFRLTLKGDGFDRHRRWSETLPFAGAGQIGRNVENEAFADVIVYL